MRSAPTLFLVALVLGAPKSASPGEPVADKSSGGVRVELPAVDLPFNFQGGGSFPSMAQSLALSKDYYGLTHRAVMELWGESHPRLGLLSVAALDYLLIWLPLTDAWLHEEWHRAVLQRRGIGSFNDVYLLQDSQIIAVSHVRDDDLVSLKRDHPAEQVRLSAAGGEADDELIFALEKEAFFYGDQPSNVFLYWLVRASSADYVFTSGRPEADAVTDKMNAREGADVPRRDFTGLDYTAWAYDLSRPDEPYEARGVHPSGVGINRYRKFSDLTPEEQRYLRLQGWLSFANFLDPSLFCISGFRATNPFNGREMKWIASVNHLLTSFGFTVDANLLIKQEPIRLVAILHSYFNQRHYFPGIDLELVRYPVGPLELGARTALWLQPEGQRFRTASAQPGGLLALRLELPLWERLHPFVELEAKSAGWVAGNVYLDPNVSARLGAALFVF